MRSRQKLYTRAVPFFTGRIAQPLILYFRISTLTACQCAGLGSGCQLDTPAAEQTKHGTKARMNETVDVPSSRGRGMPVLASLRLAPRNDAAGQDAAEQTAREQQLVDAGGVVHDDHGHGEGLRTPLQRRGEGRAQ